MTKKKRRERGKEKGKGERLGVNPGGEKGGEGRRSQEEGKKKRIRGAQPAERFVSRDLRGSGSAISLWFRTNEERGWKKGGGNSRVTSSVSSGRAGLVHADSTRADCWQWDKGSGKKAGGQKKRGHMNRRGEKSCYVSYPFQEPWLAYLEELLLNHSRGNFGTGAKNIGEEAEGSVVIANREERTDCK